MFGTMRRISSESFNVSLITSGNALSSDARFCKLLYADYRSKGYLNLEEYLKNDKIVKYIWNMLSKLKEVWGVDET